MRVCHLWLEHQSPTLQRWSAKLSPCFVSSGQATFPSKLQNVTSLPWNFFLCGIFGNNARGTCAPIVRLYCSPTKNMQTRCYQDFLWEFGVRCKARVGFAVTLFDCARGHVLYSAWPPPTPDSTGAGGGPPESTLRQGREHFAGLSL